MTNPVQSKQTTPNEEHNAKHIQQFIEEKLSTQQLVQIFEPAIRQIFRYRHPGADIEWLLANLRKEASRPQLLELASLLPHVMGSNASTEMLQGNPSASMAPISLGIITSDNAQVMNAEDVEDVPSPNQGEPSTDQIPVETGALQSIENPPLKVDKTVIQGLYLLGRGKFKTSIRDFDIAPEDAAKAAAWSKRHQRFDASEEYLAYHFKVLRADDIRSSLKSLADQGIAAPKAVDIDPDDEAALQALDDYERTVAEALYALPAIWPPDDHFIAAMSEGNQINMREFPSESMHPPNEYIDVSNLIKPDRNGLIIIEEEDMQYYAFCLFEKRPGADQLQELMQS